MNKKLLTLVILSLIGFQINAVEQIISNASRSAQSPIIKQSKGFFKERQDRFMAKKFKKKIHTPKPYIEPRKCSMLTAACIGIGGFLSGILMGFCFGLGLGCSWMPRINF